MKYTVIQYAEALAGALAEAETDKRPSMIRRFLGMIRKNKDAKLLAAIVRKTERRWLADKNLHKVAVTSASPLTAAVKKEIEAALEKKPLWEEKTDPAILAGMRILVDDELMIDASARSRLDRMFSA
ncbi:MAG: F0F1 ATP synthase subunit delta [Candidatus Sungbacteria bacterium]|nr:F0F1 ATP synthase subunit delta [Candidatus Sungbacteria bacterium]